MYCNPLEGNCQPQLGRIVVLRPEQIKPANIRVDPQFPWIDYASLLSADGLPRVSTKKQERGDSLPSQAAEIAAFAGSCLMTSHFNYTDKDRWKYRYQVSDRLPPRRVLDFLQEVIDRADVLLVTALNRLTRQALETLEKRLKGTLYVCPLGNGTGSEAIRRSFRYKNEHPKV
jgi:hypothetical protein